MPGAVPSAPITASPPAAGPLLGPAVSPAPAGSPFLPPSLGPAVAPGPSPGLLPGPPAAFEGTIQPPPSWDPYGSPGLTPAPLLPNDPYLQSGSLFGTTAPATRLLQEVRLEHHWISSGGSHSFGTNDPEITARFAFPFCYNRQTPLLVTPGFAVHLWDGPETTPADPVDLPPRVYDAYLDAAWNPQIAPWLGAELGARVGVYSDLSEVATRSIRVQARGLATLLFSPSFRIKAGVLYLDRNKVKLLPAGGIVWTPNADTRFDILFPDPKLAKRLTTAGAYEWWYYVRGEYGGGAWTVKRETGPRAGMLDAIDYNDLRVAVGTEFVRNGGLRGFAEVGLTFEREILYFAVDNPAVPEPMHEFKPSNTVFLGGGLAF